MMTEHDRGFTAARLDAVSEKLVLTQVPIEILVVPGMEYSDAANRVHVLVWGPVPFLGEGLPTSEMLEGVNAASGLAVLAHPSRSDAWKSFDPCWATVSWELKLGIESMTGGRQAKQHLRCCDMAGAVPFVGLDFHTERQSFPLGMALKMDAIVTEETVLDSFEIASVLPARVRTSVEREFGPHGLARPERIAERSRRMAASIVKFSRVFARPRTPA